MKLSHLHLEHFRNYTQLDFEFPEERIIVLSGNNAQGKTSFLEAIYLLALTKSFRASDRDFLKQFEKDYYRIQAEGFTSDNDKIKLELCEVHEPSTASSMSRVQRVLKKNSVKTSAPKFIGHLKVVLFRPEDLYMLTGEPSLRRKYLNTILIQTVPGYMKQLQIYQKILSQRNALLLQVKLGSSPVYALDLWDEQLAEAGAALVGSRQAYVKFVQDQLQKSDAPYEIEYQSAASFSVALVDALASALTQARARDTRSGHTSVGPHRDDLKLKILNQHGADESSAAHPLELTASRGELRSALMALKQAEIAWIQHKTGDTPIILLDDIFSELDTTRKNDIFDILPQDAQIVMTIAEGNPLPTSPKLRAASTVRKVHAGQISSQTD